VIIILLGSPGSGKGTQGALLSRSLKIPWVSIGELFRQEMTKRTPGGLKIQEYVSNGVNVPAKLAISILAKRLKNCPNGFILDNYPRSFDQLNALKAYSRKSGLVIDKVIHLVVPEVVSIKRLLKRAELDQKQKGYTRQDETEKLIKIRIEKGYKKDLKTIRAYFDKHSLLADVNAEDTIENVHQKIMRIIKGL
jgi:adenylate kinase